MFCRVRRAMAVLFALLLFAAAVPWHAAVAKNGDYKLLALTFDDGPGPYTGALLDALGERGAKATFFVLGRSAEKYPELIERMAAEGHQLGNHTYSHPLLTSMSKKSMIQNIEKCREILAAAAGEGTYYMRPPYGGYNSAVKSAAEAPLILWSVDPRDWQYRNTDAVVENIMKTTIDGDIILLHDIHETSIAAAVTVIDLLTEDGYEFVTVSELLRRRGIEPENGAVYTSAPNKGINLPPPFDPEAYDEEHIREHPAYDALRFARYTGLFTGEEGDALYPNKYLTRGGLAFVLARFSGEDIPAGAPEYADVAHDAEYAPHIKWAVQSRIMTGYDEGLFCPDEIVARDAFAVIIARYLKRSEAALPETDAVKFSDEDEIESWTKGSAALCAAAGLITGDDDGNFNPHGNVTRGQCAIIFERLAAFMDSDEYAASVAAMNGEPPPEQEPEEAEKPAPAEKNPQPPSDGGSAAARVAGGPIPGIVTAATGIAAVAALKISDRRKKTPIS